MQRVDVVLPFRDAARTIDQAISSIVAQTMPDWRLLLIDNASTDISSALAMRWAERDPRIVYRSATTVGVAHALGLGLRLARAPLIARMDADDVAHSERLERQLAFMEEHTGVGVLGTRTAFVSTVEKSQGMRAFVNWQNGLVTPNEHFVKRFVDAPLAHPTVMFRRELVEQHGGYDTGPLPEDHELWLRWMDAGVRFAKLPDELLTWHDHSERLSRTHTNYSVDAFFATKVKWLAKWMKRVLIDRPVIIAGTSALCCHRAQLLRAEGIAIHAYTDVKAKAMDRHRFIPHHALPPPGEAFIVSFISQRGTGDRIAAFLASRGLVEGDDFILAA